MVRYIFSQHNHFDADQLIDDMKRGRLSRQPGHGLPHAGQAGGRRSAAPPGTRPAHRSTSTTTAIRSTSISTAAVRQDDRVPESRPSRPPSREVCRQHHFQASGHSFIIRGTCAECNRARVTKRRLDLV